MKRLALDDWVTMQRKMKWRYAHKLAIDDFSSWASIAAAWDPTLDNNLKAHRLAGRPKTRWSDDITNCLQENAR